MSESKELVLVSLPATPTDLEAAFISDDYISNLIAEITQKASSVVGDINTTKGRGVYISMSSNVRKTKAAIDEAGKNLVAEMKKRPALVDASRKRVRDALDELAVEIRRPVTEWEQAEEDRKETIRKRLAYLRALGDVIDDAGNYLDSVDIQGRLAEAKLVALDDKWQEFATEAGVAKDATVRKLELAFTEARKREEETAELERLRKEAEEKSQREREERLKREAAEQAKQEAEARAKAEIEAAARREAEARAAQERAERERIEAQQRAEREAIEAQERAEREKQVAIDAERLRAQQEAEAREQARIAEVQRIADEKAKREANKEHRRTVNRAAVSALINAGVPEECAKKCITEIALGNIPAVQINY
ncbi:hypothetical protein [Martelella alba]|uniref:TolA protein n=1 Tax=Martelella alba TaxID=2590451 RepID=A0ABY2SF71_9HYPH|nr:hypothetical protein [Martelella alba]TKI03546.1 hypothetical protein FCN80_20930 [Martelella alba]